MLDAIPTLPSADPCDLGGSAKLRAHRAGTALPQEIIDNILEYLRGDVDSLRRCSLVCRAWEVSSSAQLFSRFSWPVCGGYWPFVPRPDCRTHSDARHATSSIDCHEVLASSRIRHYVRDLRLMGLCWPSTAVTVDMIKREPLSLSLLFSLPELLPSLRTLELWDFLCGEGILGPPPRPEPLSSPFTLQKLTFKSMKTTFDNTVVLSAISAFPAIDTVAIRCGCHSALDLAPTDCPRRFARTAVRRLEARYTSMLAHLMDQLAPHALRSVKLGEYSGAGAAAFLRGAPALEDLAYSVGDAPPPLLPFAHLTALEISCPVSVESAPDVEPFVEAPAWPMLAAHLAALAAPRLRTLTVALLPCSPSWLGAPPEGTLAPALAACLRVQDWAGFAGLRARCPELRTVRLAVVQDWGWIPSSYIAVPEEFLGCVGQVVRDVAQERLKEVRDILEVAAEERVGERVIIHDLDTPPDLAHRRLA